MPPQPDNVSNNLDEITPSVSTPSDATEETPLNNSLQDNVETDLTTAVPLNSLESLVNSLESLESLVTTLLNIQHTESIEETDNMVKRFASTLLTKDSEISDLTEEVEALKPLSQQNTLLYKENCELITDNCLLYADNQQLKSGLELLKVTAETPRQPTKEAYYTTANTQTDLSSEQLNTALNRTQTDEDRAIKLATDLLERTEEERRRVRFNTVINAYEEQIQSLQKNNDELNTELEKSQQAEATLKDQLVKKQLYQQRLSTQLATTQTINSQLETRLLAEQKGFKDVLPQQKQIIIGAAEEIAALSTKLESMEAQIERDKIASDEKEKEITKLQATQLSQNEKINELIEVNNDLQQKMNTYVDEQQFLNQVDSATELDKLDDGSVNNTNVSTEDNSSSPEEKQQDHSGNANRASGGDTLVDKQSHSEGVSVMANETAEINDDADVSDGDSSLERSLSSSSMSRPRNQKESLERQEGEGGIPERLQHHNTVSSESESSIGEEGSSGTDSDRDKTPKALQRNYEETLRFIKNADARFQRAEQQCTSRELLAFIKNDIKELEKIINFIGNGQSNSSSQKALKDLEDKSSCWRGFGADKRYYAQAQVLLKEICSPVMQNQMTQRIETLRTLEETIEQILSEQQRAITPADPVTRAIVKNNSFLNFFKPVNAPYELEKARQTGVEKLSQNKVVAELRSSNLLYETVDLKKGITLLQVVNVKTKQYHLLPHVIAMSYIAVKQENVIRFSTDSVNGDTSASVINKHAGNKDYLTTSTLSLLEFAQKAAEDSKLSFLIINTNVKGWEDRLAITQAHLKAHPTIRLSLVGKVTSVDLAHSDKLQAKVNNIREQYEKECKQQLGPESQLTEASNTLKRLIAASAA